LQWKRSSVYIFWECVCSLRHPACNAHASNCHLWPVRLYNIFSLYLVRCTTFEINKKHYWTQNVFWFTHYFSETFPILTRIERDVINVHSASSQLLVILENCNETWNFSKIFRKLRYQISWKVVLWKLSYSMRKDGGINRQTDRHDQANSSFSQVYESP